MRCAGALRGLKLCISFNTFDHNDGSDAGRQTHHVQKEPLRVGTSEPQEEAVDLHDVDGQGQKCLRRRKSRSEVIDGDPISKLAYASNETPGRRER